MSLSGDAHLDVVGVRRVKRHVPMFIGVRSTMMQCPDSLRP